MRTRALPIPPHFHPDSVTSVWRVPYQVRADEAAKWAREHSIRPAGDDKFRICLMLVDVQNTFCLPEFELYVGGRSGTGAIDDNRRLGEFIYRNLDVVTEVCPTMDTHQAMQIFHSIFLVDANGQHPTPFTLISEEEIARGKWRFNPALSQSLGMDAAMAEKYLLHYARSLRQGGKYDLTIWPYHAMLGGIGHALVSAIEEAIFFHSIARFSQPDFQVKGDNPLTENYSVLSPEVLTDAEGKPIAHQNTALLTKLLTFDAVVIAGQAKSHCVAWTVEDLLKKIMLQDRRLANKVYLLADCMSAVVIPGVIDYTDQAETAFAKFAEAGMHIVSSNEPLAEWGGIGR